MIGAELGNRQEDRPEPSEPLRPSAFSAPSASEDDLGRPEGLGSRPCLACGLFLATPSNAEHAKHAEGRRGTSALTEHHLDLSSRRVNGKPLARGRRLRGARPFFSWDPMVLPQIVLPHRQNPEETAAGAKQKLAVAESQF